MSAAAQADTTSVTGTGAHTASRQTGGPPATSEVGVKCGNSARTVLTGGVSVPIVIRCDRVPFPIESGSTPAAVSQLGPIADSANL
jgi:hypothetical protein